MIVTQNLVKLNSSSMGRIKRCNQKLPKIKSIIVALPTTFLVYVVQECLLPVHKDNNFKANLSRNFSVLPVSVEKKNDPEVICNFAKENAMQPSCSIIKYNKISLIWLLDVQ